MKKEQFKFKEIEYQRIDVKPDDIIAIQVPYLGASELDNLRIAAKKVFPNNNVVLLRPGMTIQTIRKANVNK